MMLRRAAEPRARHSMHFRERSAFGSAGLVKFKNRCKEVTATTD